MDDTTLDGESIRYLGDMQKLTLAAGDVIVVFVPHLINDEAAARMREIIRKRIGDYEVLILSDGIKIGVLSPAKTMTVEVSVGGVGGDGDRSTLEQVRAATVEGGRRARDRLDR